MNLNHMPKRVRQRSLTQLVPSSCGAPMFGCPSSRQDEVSIPWLLTWVHMAHELKLYLPQSDSQFFLLTTALSLSRPV